MKKRLCKFLLSLAMVFTLIPLAGNVVNATDQLLAPTNVTFDGNKVTWENPNESGAAKYILIEKYNTRDTSERISYTLTNPDIGLSYVYDVMMPGNTYYVKAYFYNSSSEVSEAVTTEEVTIDGEYELPYVPNFKFDNTGTISYDNAPYTTAYTCSLYVKNGNNWDLICQIFPGKATTSYSNFAQYIEDGKTYKAVIFGKQGTKGTIRTTLETEAILTDLATVDASVADATYTGETIHPTVTIDGFSEGTDFTVTYPDSGSIDVGTYSLTVNGIGSCKGSKTLEYTIAPKDINTLDWSDIDNCTYTGDELKPTITIDGLVEGTDYTVSYKDNVNPGIATATITGIGNYTGTKEITFGIEHANISAFNWPTISDSTYSGSEIKPAITMEGLSEGTDYTIAYPEDMTSAGTKTITITGIGNYIGTKEITYTINPANISKVTLSATSYTYNGKVHYPTVKVYCGTKQLVKGTDYTTNTYTSNKKPGTYTITVTGKGNYTGTLKKTYKINVKATTMKSLSKGTKSFTAKWTKQTNTYISGYQIQYSTSSKFTSAKTVTVTSYKTTSKTIKSLKAKKKYYVRVRTYKTISGKKYYSAWSKSKYVTTK